MKKGSSQPSPKPTQEPSNTVANQVFRLALFDHLPRKQTPKNPDSIDSDLLLHPATIKLGSLYNKGIIQEDDDRVTALIAAFGNIIQDYKTPPKKILREDLDKYISKQVQHLVESRQLSKGMGNVIKFLKHSISHISPEISEAEAKKSLLQKLHTFLEEKVLYAGESIARHVAGIINDEDVILTFGSSPLVRKILLSTAGTKKFTLVVIDTRPLNQGLNTLMALSGEDIHCVYAPLSGAATAMKDVTRVILGASCLLSNGSMLAPAGTAMIAALAKSRQIPVLVAAESYKFTEKVQLDSIVFNEMGNASEIAYMSQSTESGAATVVPTPQTVSGYRGSADKISTPTTTNVTLQQQQIQQSLHEVSNGFEYIAFPSNNQTQTSLSSGKLPFEVINLRYDLTPINNISAVATESGLIPPTSIPVLIRELQFDQDNK